MADSDSSSSSSAWSNSGDEDEQQPVHPPPPSQGSAPARASARPVNGPAASYPSGNKDDSGSESGSYKSGQSDDEGSSEKSAKSNRSTDGSTSVAEVAEGGGAADNESDREPPEDAEDDDEAEEENGNPFDEIRAGLDRLAATEEERRFVSDFVSSDTVALLCDLTEFLDTELETFHLSDQFRSGITHLPNLAIDAVGSLAADGKGEGVPPEYRADLAELWRLLCTPWMAQFLASAAEVARAEYEPELGDLPDGFFDAYDSDAASTENDGESLSGSSEGFPPPGAPQRPVSARVLGAGPPPVNGSGGGGGDVTPEAFRSRPSGKQVSYTGLPPEQPPQQQQHSSIILRNPGGAVNSAYRHSNLVERQVSILKDPNEPLGFTVAREYVTQYDKQMIMVERVMQDSPVDKQGVFQVGDLITEINEQPLESPEALQRMLRQLTGNVTFTVLTPAFNSARSEVNPVYMRACFEYRPDFDTLLPSKDLGLRFTCGDILQVVNQDNPNYWQARLVGKQGKTKLIPSQQLEEKRKAFIPMRRDAQNRPASSASCAPFAPAAKKGAKARKSLFSAETASEYDRAEIWTYEEVVFCPPEQLSCLVLVGPPGVGRRTVKKWLCSRLPNRFAEVKPVSSNASRRDGSTHAPKELMKKAIAAGEFLEYGDFNSELIGVRLDSIESVATVQHKTAIVDCLCPSVKLLRSAQFKPFVVFLAAPAVEIQQVLQDKGRTQGVLSRTRTQEEMQRAVNKSIRMERLYRPLFDLAVLCDNLESVYQKIVSCVDGVEANGRWLPAGWVNELEDQPTA